VDELDERPHDIETGKVGYFRNLEDYFEWPEKCVPDLRRPLLLEAF
jgi:hypothetical protein